MLITFIVSFVVAFVVLYYFKAKAAVGYGYFIGVLMLRTNSKQQIQGYIANFSNSNTSTSYNYWYKLGVKKALKDD
jgi:hypothetical protein